MRKINRGINALFALVFIAFLFTSCSHANFHSFNTGEVMGSHRDGCARKIDDNYWIKVTYSDDRSQDYITLYYAPDSIHNIWIGYMLNDLNNVEICSGVYVKYAFNDKYIYLLCSENNLITVVNKQDKTHIDIDLSQFEETIEWIYF